jgi:hypothetical protein
LEKNSYYKAFEWLTFRGDLKLVSFGALRRKIRARFDTVSSGPEGTNLPQIKQEKICNGI